MTLCCHATEAHLCEMVSLIGSCFPLPQGTSRAADGISQERTQAQAPSSSGEEIILGLLDYQ